MDGNVILRSGFVEKNQDLALINSIQWKIKHEGGHKLVLRESVECISGRNAGFSVSFTQFFLSQLRVRLNPEKVHFTKCERSSPF